ncbi:unnamed protein product [Arabis nemorensis]|uniref:Uncharacterized protein n=1 Tax=Arabis nemorensis TaxID=586526 RepID=A0A565BBW2_9BRAS|nr:unnamed protein product [Arabis nemorensis]
MMAIDRWVPTVRSDFPTTIPFWVKIMDLPAQYREDEQVESIGKDLGELLNWKIIVPFPMVRVEETDVAREVYAQNEKWDKVEKAAAVTQKPAAATEQKSEVRVRVMEENKRQLLEPVVGGPAHVNKGDGPSKIHKGDGPLCQAHKESPMDQTIYLEAHDVISPLKEILVGAQKEQQGVPRGGPRNLSKGPRRIEQRISKALEVKKKIAQSPLRGSHIHKHASLAKDDPGTRDSALHSVLLPSSLKTGPNKRRLRKNSKTRWLKANHHQTLK